MAVAQLRDRVYRYLEGIHIETVPAPDEKAWVSFNKGGSRAALEKKFPQVFKRMQLLLNEVLYEYIDKHSAVVSNFRQSFPNIDSYLSYNIYHYLFVRTFFVYFGKI